jgi:2-amino-4-hydroxy-6-hydroxymethyldihydropteridine diphosphokinase
VDTVIDAVIGLGSNLGDRRALLQGALRSLSASASIRAISGIYETLPVGPPQALFLNAAVRIATAERPEALLGRMLAIEREAGRERRERWGPRTLDLDLLWIDGVVVRTETLVVPHPELLHRAFALVPLLEVAPDATDPLTGHRYTETLSSLDSSGVRRLAERFEPVS